MFSYVDPQLQMPSSPTTRRNLSSIDYFSTQSVLWGTDLSGSPTPAAQEVLASAYWTGRIVQGLVESVRGSRISLDEYLSDPS